MKNLKLKLALVALLISSTGIFAQNFYITANAGYALPMNGQRGWMDNTNIDRVRNSVTGSFSSIESFESVNWSLGKGVSFGGTVGYMFNDYFGIDVGVNYLFGSKTMSTSVLKDSQISDQGTAYTESKSELSSYSNMFRLIPGFVLSPALEKFNPYLKMGMVLGFGKVFFDRQSSGTSSGPAGPSIGDQTQRTEFSGGLALGISSAIGIDFKVSEKFNIFGEVNYIGMTYSPRKSIVTESTIGGVDKLPDYSIRAKETNYEKDYSITYSGEINNDEPGTSSLISFPFSSIGVNFGVKFNL